jgi:Trk-type K+ transport system membrane component
MPSPPCPPVVFQPRMLRWPTSTVSISMSSLCVHAAGRHQFFSSLPAFKGPKPLAFWKDPECRFYLAMCLILTLVVGIQFYNTVYADAGQACATPPFRWSPSSPPPATRRPIMKCGRPCHRPSSFCACLWASAGSTGGGMKCLRIMLCFKYCYKELFRHDPPPGGHPHQDRRENGA